MKSEDRVQVSGGFKVLDEDGKVKQEGRFKSDETELSEELERIIKEYIESKGGGFE